MHLQSAVGGTMMQQYGNVRGSEIEYYYKKYVPAECNYMRNNWSYWLLLDF